MTTSGVFYFAAFLLLVLESNGHVFLYKDGLKTLARRARQVDEEESVTVAAISSAPSQPMASEPCSSDQCSNKGTCFGSRAMPFCFCQLGYAGKNCEDRFCDSQRDCASHGFCMGTASQFSCLCNLGYTGTRCELQTISAPSTAALFGTPPSTRRPIEEAQQLSENVEEQI